MLGISGWTERVGATLFVVERGCFLVSRRAAIASRRGMTTGSVGPTILVLLGSKEGSVVRCFLECPSGASLASSVALILYTGVAVHRLLHLFKNLQHLQLNRVALDVACLLLKWRCLEADVGRHHQRCVGGRFHRTLDDR